MDLLIALIAFVILITVVVVIHEFGHFIFGKIFGVRVDEFAVGFGPRILSKKRGDTTYALRILPLGGFVRMAGMLGLPNEPDAGERNFVRLSLPKRMITVIAGIVANLILGAACMTVIAMQTIQPAIVPNSPAQQAGLKDGDVVVSFNGKPVDNSSLNATETSLYVATQASHGQESEIVVQRGGNQVRSRITPYLMLYFGTGCERETMIVEGVDAGSPSTGDAAQVLNANRQGITGVIATSYDPARLGITTELKNMHSITDGNGQGGGEQAAWRIGYAPGLQGQSLIPAIATGAGRAVGFVGESANVLAQLFVRPACAKGFSGPVGIPQIASSAFQAGVIPYINVIGLISLSVAFLNVLPIPFLDGGRFLFLVIEAVRGKRLNPKREAAAYAAGLVLLILLFMVLTINDVNNLAGGSH